MPLAAENLTKQSTDEQIARAISQSISQCMKEGGRGQDQCIAMAYSMAERSTGRKIRRPSK